MVVADGVIATDIGCTAGPDNTVTPPGRAHVIGTVGFVGRLLGLVVVAGSFGNVVVVIVVDAMVDVEVAMQRLGPPLTKPRLMGPKYPVDGIQFANCQAFTPANVIGPK